MHALHVTYIESIQMAGGEIILSGYNFGRRQSGIRILVHLLANKVVGLVAVYP